MSCSSRNLILVTVAASVALAAASTGASAAVVESPPVWPVPASVPASPPPIPSLPAAAAATPPPDEIVDPLRPSATCGGWYLQSGYGNRWAAASSWWEYRCTADFYEYYPHPCEGTGACEAVCYGYPYDCYSLTEQWVDYFYWDGSRAVFYGESFFYAIDEGYSGSSLSWWDAPTATWYAVAPAAPPPPPPPPPVVPPTASFTFTCAGLRCSFDGSESAPGSSPIASYSWGFGDGAGGGGITSAHTYGRGGTYAASLTVTDANGASATVSRDVVVVNLAPTAAFTVTCSGLRCTVDGSGSSDPDGAPLSYAWSFGDGLGGSGRTTSHDYPKAGAYVITLTVTESAGASATVSQKINPIALSARGYKQGGQQKVDLSWNGIAGASFDVYRDGERIRVLQGTAYTDVVPKGTHVYRVCATASATCSMEVTVTP
jgi:PKD repeat protein